MLTIIPEDTVDEGPTDGISPTAVWAQAMSRGPTRGHDVDKAGYPTMYYFHTLNKSKNISNKNIMEAT